MAARRDHLALVDPPAPAGEAPVDAGYLSDPLAGIDGVLDDLGLGDILEAGIAAGVTNSSPVSPQT